MTVRNKRLMPQGIADWGETLAEIVHHEVAASRLNPVPKSMEFGPLGIIFYNINFNPS